MAGALIFLLAVLAAIALVFVIIFGDTRSEGKTVLLFAGLGLCFFIMLIGMSLSY